MRVLVTGGRGFVGKHLVPHLESEGCDVVAVDREVDVADQLALARVFGSCAPEGVVHLAAESSVSASSERAEQAFRVNFLGTHALLTTALACAPRAKVLLVSSGQIYGDGSGREPFREEDPLCPASPYAWTKACADRLGASFVRQGLRVFRVRPFNHSGPGRPAHFVESGLAKQVAEIAYGKRPPVLEVGNLDSIRDFLDVDDVVRAYAALLRSSAPPAAYNVASGHGLSIRQLLDWLLAWTGLRGRVEVRVDPSRWRPTETSVGSALRLRRTTAWQPRRPFETTLAALLEFWRRRVEGG